ncbi:molybdopterin molybdotransferase MoeA [Microbacterium pygmaeum]|uniref:Molybdopterin molybdenumtransferase n=1 Tax=Microbacterium pygmaeum TaxID=370764 RepID=A0A1G7XVL3_9MICO|nr:gephyrin-like molybdotransferase Glp [Microbacterium pygmaeum]SDG88235.1 molybdopterin molybdotransferase [Microbacterium pygmaeum]
MTEPMRTVEEHLARILASVQPLGGESVPVGGAIGRTLTEPLRALVDIPVFDNSAMDGFAVRFADVAGAASESPVRLRVVADLPAGSALDPPIGPGEAARIMTGSAVPTAADVIVPFEDTALGLEGSLEMTLVRVAPRTAGLFIRRRAADASVGDELLPRGTVVGPLQAAAAAAAGATTFVVAATPRVAVISTGSELVQPGSPLRRGQIPESNSELLTGLVAEAGGAVVLRRSVADDEAALREVLRHAADVAADVVVFSGGVSAGAYEVVKNTLGPGGEMSFVKVAMQPGKPQGFGRSADGALLFGLPGNPVSVAVSFETFVRPALLALQSRAALHRPVLRLPAAVGWRTPPNRRQYLPAVIDRSDPGAWSVAPATAGGSGSHLAGGLGRAEAYAIVPAEVDEVEAGTAVDVMLLT